MLVLSRTWLTVSFPTIHVMLMMVAQVAIRMGHDNNAKVRKRFNNIWREKHEFLEVLTTWSLTLFRLYYTYCFCYPVLFACAHRSKSNGAGGTPVSSYSFLTPSYVCKASKIETCHTHSLLRFCYGCMSYYHVVQRLHSCWCPVTSDWLATQRQISLQRLLYSYQYQIYLFLLRTSRLSYVTTHWNNGKKAGILNPWTSSTS